MRTGTERLDRVGGAGRRTAGDRTGQSSKRGTGWERLRAAIGDASRPALAAPPPSSSAPLPGPTAVASPPGAS